MTKGNTKNFGKIWGSKTQEFLTKMSREAVEENANISVLYFKVDYNRTKVNFYGEMEQIQFENPMGVELKGIVSVTEKEAIKSRNVLAKSNSLTFSIYVEQLNEKNIDPVSGDFFSFKKRFYTIWDYTNIDINKNVVAANDIPIWKKFICIETEEEMFKFRNQIYDGANTFDDIKGIL